MDSVDKDRRNEGPQGSIAPGGEEIQRELLRLGQVTAEMFLLAERERLHLASEIKDSIGQTLLLARLKIGLLSERLDPEEYELVIEDLRNILDLAVWEASSLAHRLYPVLLAEAGLAAALKWLAKQMEIEFGLRVEYSPEPEREVLDEIVRSVLYYAVRELLINVSRHAKSGAAKLGLGWEADRVRLSVEDRGVGFEVRKLELKKIEEGKSTGESGLAMIHQKIMSIGGVMKVASKPGGGTHVTIFSPFRS